MNKVVGEEVGALISIVTDVSCDDEGTALGRCIRVRVQVDIHKPLLRWTNVHIGGTTCKIMLI